MDNIDNLSIDQLRALLRAMAKDGASPDVKQASMQAFGEITADVVIVRTALCYLSGLAQDMGNEPVVEMLDDLTHSMKRIADNVDKGMTAFGAGGAGMTKELVERLVEQRMDDVRNNRKHDPMVSLKIATEVRDKYKVQDRERTVSGSHLTDELLRYAREKVQQKTSQPASMDDFARELAQLGKRPKKDDSQLN